MMSAKKKAHLLKRKERNNLSIKAKSNRPRLAVFRSGQHIYAQVVCNVTGNIVACASSLEKEIRSKLKTGANVEAATQIGQLIAERAVKLGLKQVVFDRGGYPYHGRVKAVAEGARQAGLDF